MTAKLSDSAEKCLTKMDNKIPHLNSPTSKMRYLAKNKQFK